MCLGSTGELEALMGAGGMCWWRRELEALALLRHASEQTTGTPSRDAVAAVEGSGCGLQYIGDGISGGGVVGVNGISVGGGVIGGVVGGGVSGECGTDLRCSRSGDEVEGEDTRPGEEEGEGPGPPSTRERLCRRGEAAAAAAAAEARGGGGDPVRSPPQRPSPQRPMLSGSGRPLPCGEGVRAAPGAARPISAIS